MTPYIEMACGANEWPVYVSELGLGREKIYWRIGLLTMAQVSFTVKDRDMFFDDLIGNCRIERQSERQEEERAIELKLVGEEEKEEGNGVLKVLTTPVECDGEADKEEWTEKVFEAKTYLLRMGGARVQKL